MANVLRTLVDLTFLLLAVIIIVVLLKDTRNRELVDTARNDIAIVKQDLGRVIANNTGYLESKINKAEERQDNYQSTTSRRLHILEQRIEHLDNNKNQRIVNNNINTLTNNNK